jgi:hypothetical protein
MQVAIQWSRRRLLIPKKQRLLVMQLAIILISCCCCLGLHVNLQLHLHPYHLGSGRQYPAAIQRYIFPHHHQVSKFLNNIWLLHNNSEIDEMYLHTCLVVRCHVSDGPHDHQSSPCQTRRIQNLIEYYVDLPPTRLLINQMSKQILQSCAKLNLYIPALR